MSKNKNPEFVKLADRVESIEAADFLHNSYLPYTYYVIYHRALASGLDGLKPVQRRVLWTLYQTGSRPNGKTIKTATVSGATAGKYHPHAPMSVSGAIAKMCQWFNTRVPLLAFQGNVGFQTGDIPAADRYYEVKINEAGMELIKEVDDKTVKMVPNYDGTLEEPLVLPIRWPVLIINGTSGIAVGYASKMLPHNPDEIIDLCIARLRGKIKTIDDVLKIAPGPDFPTGGIVIGTDGIRDYYETGTGTVVVRGKYTVEDVGRGIKQIIFNELPYQIPAEQVVTEVREGRKKGKFVDIAEINDYSDRQRGLSLVVRTKSGGNVENAIKDLFAHTSCEVKIGVNATSIVDGAPKSTSLIDYVDMFLNLRVEIAENRIKNTIEKLSAQIHTYDGITKVLVDIDKAIEIIRKSDTADIATDKLKKTFKIDDEQANHILSLRLRTLTKYDTNEIESKTNELKAQLKELSSMSPEGIIDKVISDLEDTKKVISSPRRTAIEKMSLSELKEANKAQDKLMELIKSNVDCYVVTDYFNNVYLSLEKPETPYKSIFKTKTMKQVGWVQKDGSITTVQAGSLSMSPTPIGNSVAIVDIEQDNTIGIVAVSSTGGIQLYKKNNGKQLCTLIMGEEVVYAQSITKEDYDNNSFALLSKNGYVGHFKLGINGISSAGGFTKGLEQIRVTSATMVTPDDDTIIIKSGDGYSVMPASDLPVKSRGIKGVLGISLKKSQKPEDFPSTEIIAGKFNKINGKKINYNNRPAPVSKGDITKIE